MNEKIELALKNLRQSLEDAPKSKAGFVNWKRSSGLQRECYLEIHSHGVPLEEARELALNIAKPFDTHYSKI